MGDLAAKRLYSASPIRRDAQSPIRLSAFHLSRASKTRLSPLTFHFSLLTFQL